MTRKMMWRQMYHIAIILAGILAIVASCDTGRHAPW